MLWKDSRTNRYEVVLCRSLTATNLRTNCSGVVLEGPWMLTYDMSLWKEDRVYCKVVFSNTDEYADEPLPNNWVSMPSICELEKMRLRS